MRSCSAALSSGLVMLTSSTLRNWCWRSMPRVSRPAEPASLRKHSDSAVTRSGSDFSATISSRTRLVSGTSAVGISQRLSVVRNESSVNFGNWPVPYMVVSLTSSGTCTSA